MLINLPTIFDHKVVEDTFGFEPFLYSHKLSDGIYETDFFGLDDLLLYEGVRSFETFHGVCDHAEQIVSKYSELLNNRKRNYIIVLTKVSKDEQPEEGGWRWEKWGTYIGFQKSQANYLYDEPEIETVYVFAVYEILGFVISA